MKITTLEKHTNEAEQVGLTLLGAAKIKNTTYRTYEFKSCGHTAELKTGAVRINKFICKDCLVERLNQEAEQVGLTLLGAAKIKNKDYRTYAFNSCGHTTEMQTGHVRINNFTCNECLAEKLSQEAEQVGLTLLGKGKNRNYHTYEFNSCKHTAEIQTSAVRRNSFRCNVCEETSRTQPSSTYLLKITSCGFTWLKYGYAKSIDNRTKQYGLPADSVVELVKHDSYATGKEARTYEESNHTKLGEHKLCSKMMKKYHTKQGQTECYPLTMLDQLTATFNAKLNKNKDDHVSIVRHMNTKEKSCQTLVKLVVN